MIHCDKGATELGGSTNELVDDFVNVCRSMAVMLDKAKARPDVDVWRLMHKMLEVAQRGRYEAEVYDLSALKRRRDG